MMMTGARLTGTGTTNGTSMLMLACFGGHVDAAEALLEHGADLHSRNAWDCDAGHFAAMGGDVATCQWLAHRGLRLDRRQRSGHAAIHKAADLGQLDVCQYLLRHSTAPQLANLKLLAEEAEDASKPAAGAETEGKEGLLSRLGLTEQQLAKRRQAYLPSALAENKGFADCAALLRKAGM